MTDEKDTLDIDDDIWVKNVIFPAPVSDNLQSNLPCASNSEDNEDLMIMQASAEICDKKTAAAAINDSDSDDDLDDFLVFDAKGNIID